MKSKFFSAALWVGILLLPAAVNACPACFASSPHRTGLIWATVFLLPLPFILAGLFAYWVIRDAKENS